MIAALVVGFLLGVYVAENVGITPSLPPDGDLAIWALVTIGLAAALAFSYPGWAVAVGAFGVTSAFALSARREREHDARVSAQQPAAGAAAENEPELL